MDGPIFSDFLIGPCENPTLREPLALASFAILGHFWPTPPPLHLTSKTAARGKTCPGASADTWPLRCPTNSPSVCLQNERLPSSLLRFSFFPLLFFKRVEPSGRPESGQNYSVAQGVEALPVYLISFPTSNGKLFCLFGHPISALIPNAENEIRLASLFTPTSAQPCRDTPCFRKGGGERERRAFSRYRGIQEVRNPFESPSPGRPSTRRPAKRSFCRRCNLLFPSPSAAAAAVAASVKDN